MWCALPALLMLLVWLVLQPSLITQMVVAELPAETRALPPERLGLIVNDIKNLASGNITSAAPDPTIRAAAQHYQHLQAVGATALWVAVLGLGLIGAGLSWKQIAPKLRARNRVEKIA
ncbi:phosphate ABC transporter permease family protein, partial [Arthrospira platensis SPKY1]|nr:phosphate ABC transporter permease family protein [Arthrospira platensis SPKY1]